MGTSSTKKIDINVIVKLESNDVKFKTVRASIDSNNPSTTVNINSITNNETAQIKTNTEDNTNEPPPPTSLTNSSQTTFNNSNNNDQFDINAGGDGGTDKGNQNVNERKNNNANIGNIINNPRGNKKEDKYYKPPNITQGNIDINSGGNIRKGEYYRTPDEVQGNKNNNSGGNKKEPKYYKTPNEVQGNKNNNSGGNKKEDKYYKTPNETQGIKKEDKYYKTPNETQGNKKEYKYYKTPNEAQGITNTNSGGNKKEAKYYKTPNETPYYKPINTANIGYLSKNDVNNNDSDELGFSRNIILTDMKSIDDSKELMIQKGKVGYFPIFMKLDEYKALFFFVFKYETLENVLKEYKDIVGIIDDKDYTLFNKNTNKVVPQDVSIEDLGINKFTYISNI